MKNELNKALRIISKEIGENVNLDEVFFIEIPNKSHKNKDFIARKLMERKSSTKPDSSNENQVKSLFLLFFQRNLKGTPSENLDFCQ